MPARSAGILFHRPGPKVLLVHPGGPFWARKDAGGWQLPKGLVEPGEDDETAARREAGEELGLAVIVPLVPLGEVKQAGGKLVVVFAAAMDVDVGAVVSNRIEIEWPPCSGRRITVPEVDEARWFTLDDAHGAMLASQRPFLDRLLASLA